jgi:hypothetical protein
MGGGVDFYLECPTALSVAAKCKFLSTTLYLSLEITSNWPITAFLVISTDKMSLKI